MYCISPILKSTVTICSQQNTKTNRLFYSWVFKLRPATLFYPVREDIYPTMKK